jgi:hypothetical protein
MFLTSFSPVEASTAGFILTIHGYDMEKVEKFLLHVLPDKEDTELECNVHTVDTVEIVIPPLKESTFFFVIAKWGNEWYPVGPIIARSKDIEPSV